MIHDEQRAQFPEVYVNCRKNSLALRVGIRNTSWTTRKTNGSGVSSVSLKSALQVGRGIVV